MIKSTIALFGALALAASATMAPAIQVTPLDDHLVSVVNETRGTSREEAVDNAKRDAVLAATGRVLLDGKLFLADDLLQKYLSNYYAKFVDGVEITDDSFTEGRAVINSRVFVNYDRLIADLNEKRFLYTPAYKPQFAVFLDEKLDGQEIPQQVGRQLLQNALKAKGIKSYEGAIEDPKVTVDVSSDDLLLANATVAAQRRDVEFIISGKSTTKLREERRAYYDTFFFYDTNLEVSFIRVDTGEKLFTTTTSGSASSRDRADAVRTAIERAADAASIELANYYKGFWPRVVQGKADYEILLTGTDDELTRIVSQQVGRVSTGTTIEVKKKFDRSAVLSVSSSSSRADVINAIRGCSYPTLTIIREVGKNKFEVQVAGN